MGSDLTLRISVSLPFFFKVEIMISDIIEGCDDYLREYMHLKHVKNST